MRLLKQIALALLLVPLWTVCAAVFVALMIFVPAGLAVSIELPWWARFVVAFLPFLVGATVYVVWKLRRGNRSGISV